MKKALLTLVALSISVSLFAQGTVVFSNLGSGKNVRIDRTGDGVGDADLANSDGVQVSLWVAPTGTTDPNAASWVMLGNPSALLLTGVFSAGTRTVPNTVVANATSDTVYSFQVRAWETSIYGTAADAWATASRTPNAKVTISSPVVESKTGNWGTPPSNAINLSPIFGAAPNILVGTVVPEPSVLALGVLGIGALLMLRRRS